ncbi:MAG: hypothetical protein C0498_01395 [Anaerolinea sp.]|nr:hypothetical protein [Anaerolinea sp.]
MDQAAPRARDLFLAIKGNRAVRVAIAVPVWIVQYGLWVPLVILWWAALWLVRAAGAVVAGALRLGFLGIALLFVPIVGWLVIAWLLFRRPDYSREVLVELRRRNDAAEGGVSRWTILRPWLIDFVRG